MTTLDSSLLLGILAGGLGTGGVAGYLSRRVQKIEDRIDTTNLKVLPAVYYNIFYFEESIGIFGNNGSPAYFLERIKEINSNLKLLISSGDILPSEISFKPLFNFQSEIETLEAFLKRNTDQNNDINIDDLRNSLKDGAKKYSLIIDLQTLSKDAERLRISIDQKLKHYKSFSWKLFSLILALGFAIAAIELLISK
jgi:hypothetical protein